MREKIDLLRSKNEGWGAISILVELEEVYNYDKADLPSSDSVNRYLQEKGFIKPKTPKSDLPQELLSVKNSHDLWEMDAQGAVKVDGLGYISMINIKDSKSKIYIMSFPVLVKGQKSQPKTDHYLWTLRLAFEEFGLPKAIQVDKDSVFIDNTSKSPFPSKLHLFLLGLGIELHFIQVSPPAKQAMVERSHQTIYNQVLKGKTYQTWQELFVNTNTRRGILNKSYPCRTLNKKAPLQAFPKAIHSQRFYTIKREEKILKIKLIEQYLEKCIWHRKVSSAKTISLKKVYYLKKAKPGTYVQIRFSAVNNVNKKLIFRDVNELLLQEVIVKDFIKNLLNFPSCKELVVIKNDLFKNKNFPL